MSLESKIIHNMDCLKGMKELESTSINLLYTDPPYNMDSRYTIDSISGHYYFKGQGKDFMSKWDAMDGRWWQKYFTEAYRIMKFGGFIIMHNIDRQSDMWTYYARKAGFMPMQKLYWLFISNFPKATDVALMIDKKLGVKRKKIGEADQYVSSGTGVYNWNNPDLAKEQKKKMTDIRGGAYLKSKRGERATLIRDITVATSDIAKKYDGYKYGQACLKQILEEILVFRKEPYGGVISDILNIERNSIIAKKLHPSILNIGMTKKLIEDNRHTPQMIVDSRIAPYLRSDRSKSLDTVGINKSLIKIKFLEEDFEDYYFYEPKTSKFEKEEGLARFASVDNRKATKGLYTADGKDKWATKSKNPHPTPKPMALCKWILGLFRPPAHIVVLDTFAGQGSIPRACEEMQIEWYGFELNPEYCIVANQKVKSAHLTLF